jgi:nucleotide-binding universal stress UspA family protein
MKILLTSDGSSHSRRATRWLRDRALPTDTTITVLTVATLHEPPRDAQTVRHLWATARADAHRVGERAAKVLKRRWPRVEVVVAEGDPRVEIVHAAEEMKVAMIVLGARGVGRIKRLLIGSTSLAVARYAPCPVAIVRGRPHKTGRVLVAIDGSSGSRAAMRFLSISEIERDSRVSLLHVLPRATDVRRPTDSSNDRKLGSERRREKAAAESLLRDAAATLDESRRVSERLVAHGDPAREIVKIARSRDVDLIILGARGLRTLGRLLLGSVSETVLHQASRPVIIVRE